MMKFPQYRLARIIYMEKKKYWNFVMYSIIKWRYFKKIINFLWIVDKSIHQTFIFLFGIIIYKYWQYSNTLWLQSTLTNLDLKIPRIFQELVLSAVLDIIMDSLDNNN